MVDQPTLKVVLQAVSAIKLFMPAPRLLHFSLLLAPGRGDQHGQAGQIRPGSKTCAKLGLEGYPLWLPFDSLGTRFFATFRGVTCSIFWEMSQSDWLPGSVTSGPQIPLEPKSMQGQPHPHTSLAEGSYHSAHPQMQGRCLYI